MVQYNSDKIVTESPEIPHSLIERYPCMRGDLPTLGLALLDLVSAGKRHHRSSRKVQLAATDTSSSAAIFRDPLAIWVCRSLPPSWRRSLPPSGRCLPRLGGHSSPSSDRHNMSRLARHNAPPPLCAAVPPEDLTSSPNACLEEELQATSSYRISLGPTASAKPVLSKDRDRDTSQRRKSMRSPKLSSHAEDLFEIEDVQLAIGSCKIDPESASGSEKPGHPFLRR
uniref:Uncharacterized protein n=1 Tax=Zea mays TaxID=4577 RepID=A0A804NRJ8_MAIZE